MHLVTLFALLVQISAAFAKDTPIGTAYSPSNFPNSSPKEIDEYFTQAQEIGNHVTFIIEWKDNLPVPIVREIQRRAKEKGLKFHLHLSPIALYGGRKEPALPAPLAGKGFSDIVVRIAFIAKALELASLKPDYLGLGTEVNLLAQNPKEFQAYTSLVRDATREIKKQYPSQVVTVSFQWDILLTQKQFDVLPHFNQIDVYSFTTYPNAFGTSDKIPADYYACVRKLLPTQAIGFSEVGWASEGNEAEQALFYSRLPAFMKSARPEYVTLGLLHDVQFFGQELASLNSVGIRHHDGRPKRSWEVIKNLEFRF